ncbi:hypothetical protein Acr_25g0003010 [Actinidia rufa]|uniref:At3g05675-like ankyrin-like domain-containing protein n=1 Tax=Actinidia rufa TaxID=165716 RepID=A0A7J0GYL9_9ERIC|nr:hypothetical protein Acr_25g0003010 [Actinidia rufa]
MAIREVGVEYYGYNDNSSRPSALLNSIFMTTVNTAAKTLVAVASTTKAEHVDKWRPADHVRFILMLMTWFAVWVLRVLMDHFPCSLLGPCTSQSYLLQGYSSSVGSFDFPPLPSSALTPSSSLDLVLHQGSDEPSLQALGRALTHIFALLNEIPASSRKYQFAVAMADKIVDENARHGHAELLQINREALSSAFARTLGLLYRSLKTSSNTQAYLDDSGAWTSRILRLIPMGNYVAPYVNCLSVCLGTIYSTVAGHGVEKKRHRRRRYGEYGDDGTSMSSDVVAEKHAQELLWITNKLRMCGASDEAVFQWSLASSLASLSLTASPRVQGSILKISSILLGEITRANFEIPSEIKFRVLVLWLPLFCYADNGLAYPVLTGYEKAETERTIDEVISSLPAMDQEVVLTNWLQDFSITPSDWPNLQISYDRWCHSTRKLIAS